MIRVTLNGRDREVPPGRVIDLLEHLGLAPAWTLVELNLDPVARDRYADTPLKDGDVIEVVRAVAGG